MTKYHVWRRNDGYVSATTYPPMPAEDFEVLLVSADWSECKAAIIEALSR